jgi:hypothetical protein
MGVFLRLLDSVICWKVVRSPKGWQASEKSYKSHKRHSHCEDDDVAREGHGEGQAVVLVCKGRMTGKNGESGSKHFSRLVGFAP